MRGRDRDHAALSFTESVMAASLPRFSSFALSVVLLAGTAGAAPAPSAATPACTVMVRSATTDMLLLDADGARLARKIERHLGGTGAVSRRVDVAITSYDKGSRYVRSMVSGLNDIHADLVVTVYELPGNTVAQTLSLSETSPGIGVEGSSSRIGDIEDALVKAVAEALRS